MNKLPAYQLNVSSAGQADLAVAARVSGSLQAASSGDELVADCRTLVPFV